MSRLYQIFAESFLDGFNGAGLFGHLERPYAVSPMIDSSSVEDFRVSGKLLKSVCPRPAAPTSEASTPESLPSASLSVEERKVLSEETFKRMIVLERGKTELSLKPFLLMLLDTGDYQASKKSGEVTSKILTSLLASTRETDLIGWYNDRATIGVMFTELAIDDKHSITNTMLARLSSILQGSLTSEQFNKVSISFHFFPDTWDDASRRPNSPDKWDMGVFQRPDGQGKWDRDISRRPSVPRRYS